MRVFPVNRHVAFIGMTALAFCLISGTANAGEESEKDRAEKHFKAGISLLATYNFLVAAQEFESSVSLRPTKSGFFNLAICYFELRRYDDAAAAVERLKKEFQTDLNEQWINEIAAFEAKLKASVVPVEFTSNIAGATISVNGKALADSSKNKSLLLAPGDHEVKIVSEDYEHISEMINIKAGQGKMVYHFLVVNPSDNKQKKQEAAVQNTTYPVHFENESGKKKNNRRKGLSIGAAVALSIGGITGLTAIATGVVHLVNVSRISDSESCHGNTCTDLTLESELDKMKKLGVATNVLISVSAVTLLTGTILAVVNGNTKKRSNKRVSLDPTGWKDGGGLTLSGTF